MEMPPNIRSTKKQSPWTILDQELAKDPPTKDSRRRSLERRQWLAESRVLTILSEMQLHTTKAEHSPTERASPILRQRKAPNTIAKRCQDSKVQNQPGMGSVVRTIKSTNSTLVTK
jgi:hypothetical protein